MNEHNGGVVLNTRQKDLLRTLVIKNGQIVNLVDLAEQLDCAEKTVRNDLKRIEEWLADYPSANLKRQPGIGITLELTESDRSAIFQKLVSYEQKSEEDRFFEIAYLLLVSSKAITLEELSKRYYVSKTIVKKELETIAKWLEGYNLELISKPRVGNIVHGTELQKRSALAHLSELISSIVADKSYVLDLFLPYEVETVQRVLNQLGQNYPTPFTDGAMESLLVHALIMIKRTRQKSPVKVPSMDKEAVYPYKEFEYATWFLEQLEAAFKIKFPEDELIYFTWHLISAKKKEDSEGNYIIQDEFLVQVISDLMMKLGNLTLFSFEKDAILKKGLAVHIYSVINRIKYGFPITNPLLSDIKKMYPYLFNMVMIALDDINDKHGLDVPEDEAAYLVLHFQASIERLEGKRETQRRTLIVCHLGVGMSYLLQAKIEHYYQDLQVVACIGKADIRDYVKNHVVDLIISTVELEKVNIPYVMVSPLLEARDKETLNQFMVSLETGQEADTKEVVLPSLIRADLVHLDVEKEHPLQVIELLGNTLYQKGFIEKEFIHSALVRERKSATSIGGGIAIPHGLPTMVIQSAIAVAVLKQPIEWGNEQVSVVFMLAISNQVQKLNRGAISQIVGFSEDPSAVQGLIESKQVKEFLEQIK